MASRSTAGPEWFDLDKQLEHMDQLGHQVDVVCSIGPLSVAFSDLAPSEGRDVATLWNEEMAGAQRKLRIRAGSGPAPRCRWWIPRIAIEVLDHAISKLGLMGANLPGSVGSDPRIDLRAAGAVLRPGRGARRAALFLHPTDAVFEELSSKATTARSI